MSKQCTVSDVNETSSDVSEHAVTSVNEQCTSSGVTGQHLVAGQTVETEESAVTSLNVSDQTPATVGDVTDLVAGRDEGEVVGLRGGLPAAARLGARPRCQ